VRGGGRVVKNVAGFDLVRLVTGAWGTLGVITEATVRLRPRPEADETLALAAPPPALAALVVALRDGPFAPWATELVSAPLARHLGVADAAVVLVRLGGNGEAVRAQRAALSALGDAGDAPGDVWRRLAGAEAGGAVAVVRWSSPPAQVAETWARALVALDGLDALAHASLGRGVVRCVVRGSGDAAAHDALARALGAAVAGTRIFERLPAALWPRLSAATAGDPLSARVRERFDPGRVLNAGILGEDVA
jgi:glycolate oxidase FAD binding subunit